MYSTLRRSYLLLSNVANGRKSIHFSSLKYHTFSRLIRRHRTFVLSTGLGTGLLIGVASYHAVEWSPLFSLSYGDNKINAGDPIDGLPIYNMAEVAKHSSTEKRMWITFKEGVYDVTDFVESHPGGDAIMMGIGSAIDPFWNIYAVHKTPQVFEILESYRIGNLNPEEAKSNQESADPYQSDPNRSPELIPSSKKPFNAEPLPELLVKSYITPTEYFYVRNHLPVPLVDVKTYEIEIEGPGIKSMTLTLDDLKKLPKYTITATVMCAGNRRSEMSAVTGDLIDLQL